VRSSLGSKGHRVVMLKAYVILLLAASLFLCACASTAQFPGAAVEGTPGATVKGIGGTVGSFFAVASPHPGVSKEVLIFSVNGKKVNGMGATNLVRLTPGTQELVVSCSFNIEGQLIQQHSSVSLQIENGHTYQLDAKPPCVVSVTDATVQ